MSSGNPSKNLLKLFQNYLVNICKESPKQVEKSFENPSKNLPKTSQNPSKNLPKSYQNPIPEGIQHEVQKNIEFCSFCCASWARPGRFGRRLGASCVCPGGVLARLGASWERLGASWERLGSLLARLGPPVWCLSFC